RSLWWWGPRGGARPRPPPAPGGSALLQLGAQFFFLLSELRREGLAEVFRRKHLADLDLGLPCMRIGAALHPIDRLLERGNLPDPEAGDELLGLGEGAVRDDALAPGKLDAGAFGAWLQALAGEHDAGLHQLLVEFAHGRQQFLARHLAGFGVLRGFDQDHELHGSAPSCLDGYLSRTSPGVACRHFAAAIFSR